MQSLLDFFPKIDLILDIILFALSRCASFKPPHSTRPFSFPFNNDGTRVQFNSWSAVLVGLLRSSQDQIRPEINIKTINASRSL